MRNSLILALAAIMAVASAQTPVSGYKFSGNLDAYLDNNAPYVLPLEHRTGGRPTQLFGPTNFVMDTVGTRNKMVAQFPVDSFFRVNHGMNGNGGGFYLNEYSLVVDVKFTNAAIGGFASLFNTTADNGNDGDTFIRWDDDGNGNPIGRIGISGQYAGEISPNVWNRIVITYTALTGTFKYYVNGALAQTVTGQGGIDGRFAIYTWNDEDPDADHYDLFADNDVDRGAGFVSLLVNYDQVLDGTFVAGLGPVGTPIGETTEVVVSPSSFQVRLGRLDSGNLQSLLTEDNNALRVCKFIVPNLVVPPVNVEVNGVSPTANPSSLKTAVKSRMVHTGSFRQTLEMFNFTTNTWDATDTRSDAINTAYATRELTGTGALGRYVGAGSAIRMRYTVRQTGPAAVVNWCHDTDLVNWTVGN
ncbi:MAG: hypothetical protein KIT11_00555 [Fimbriimonadaceae bacterium]|nr:hypothetical protein [Fimbriimonadaceae bacterium]QYK55136.1 MAG: hypothetical protein KF733_08980 [Fimbriimonadaceae bacterium]